MLCIIWLNGCFAALGFIGFIVLGIWSAGIQREALLLLSGSCRTGACSLCERLNGGGAALG